MYIAWAIKVKQNDFIIHENYDRSKVSNDIALVRLAHKIPENEYVNSISLPSRAETNENLVGKTANVSGFGIESDRKRM